MEAGLLQEVPLSSKMSYIRYQFSCLLVRSGGTVPSDLSRTLWLLQGWSASQSSCWARRECWQLTLVSSLHKQKFSSHFNFHLIIIHTAYAKCVPLLNKTGRWKKKKNDQGMPAWLLLLAILGPVGHGVDIFGSGYSSGVLCIVRSILLHIWQNNTLGELHVVYFCI